MNNVSDFFSSLSIQYYSSLLVFTFLYIIVVAGRLCAIFCSVALSKIQSQLRVHFNTFSFECWIARAAECVNWCFFLCKPRKRREIFSFNENQWLYIWLTATPACSIPFFRFFSPSLFRSKPQKCYIYSWIVFFIIIGRLLWQHSLDDAVIPGACRKSDRVSYSKLHNYMIWYIISALISFSHGIV